MHDRVGRPEMVLAPLTIHVLTARSERNHLALDGFKSALMNGYGFSGDIKEIEPFHWTRRIGEVLIDEALFEAHSLEDLCADVGHVGRNAHARHDLIETLHDGVQIVVDILCALFLVLGERLHHRKREIGMHRFSTIAAEYGKVMNGSR